MQLGVGHNPDSVPRMRGANGGSGNTVPLRVIPDLSEAPENFVQSPRAKGTDVFDDGKLRVGFFNESKVLKPETTSGS